MLAMPADHNIKVHATLKEGFIIGEKEKKKNLRGPLPGPSLAQALEILHFVSPAAGVI